MSLEKMGVMWVEQQNKDLELPRKGNKKKKTGQF